MSADLPPQMTPEITSELTSETGIRQNQPQPEQTAFFKHILFPTDFSAAASQAFAYLLTLAQPQLTQVSLLHVNEYQDPFLVELYAMKADYFKQLEKQRESWALKQLEALRQRLTEQGISAELYYKQGHRGQQILEQARFLGCDLIVMGSRGLGAAQALLIGSTSRYVLHHSPCPLLIAPCDPV